MPEPNPLNPIVKIMLGGKERNLLFTMGSLIAIEEQSGRDMLSGNAVPDRFTLKDVRLFGWAALLHEEPSLTLREFEHMVTLRNITAVTEAVVAALEAAMPNREKEQGVEVERPLVQ